MKLRADQWLIDTYTFTYKGKKCEVFFVDTYESQSLWRDLYIELDGEEVSIWQDGVPEEVTDPVCELAHSHSCTAKEIESIVGKLLNELGL